MKIALASTSTIKLNACKKVFNHIGNAEFIARKVPSGVNEQPMNAETLTGAVNRVFALRGEIPDADYCVSIENGIFEEDGAFIDRALAVVLPSEGMLVGMTSEGVAFPADCVEEARERGFDTWTVGQVMAERGIVTKHDDPHLDLSGRSRQVYIEEALTRALQVLNIK